MKRVSALILLCQLGVCFAVNSIVAIVNEDVITLQSIEQQLNDANSFNEKIDIVEQQIDFVLQISKARELSLNPSQGDINGVLTQLSHDNNISMEQLRSYAQFPSLIQQITNRLSILGLQQYITKDLSIELSEDEINNCTSNINDKNTKQIRIAQIIISEIDNSDVNIVNSTIDGNECSGPYRQGGGICVFNSVRTFSLTIENTIISNNLSVMGGGIALLNCVGSLNKNTIVNNSSQSGGYGGGIWLDNSLLLRSGYFLSLVAIRG